MLCINIIFFFFNLNNFTFNKKTNKLKSRWFTQLENCTTDKFQFWTNLKVLGIHLGLPANSYFDSEKEKLHKLKIVLCHIWTGGAAASGAGVLRNRRRYKGERGGWRWGRSDGSGWGSPSASPQHPDPPCTGGRGFRTRGTGLGGKRPCPYCTELLRRCRLSETNKGRQWRKNLRNTPYISNKWTIFNI